MSIKAEYFRYLDHLGETITMERLAAAPDRRDAVALRHDIDHDLDLALEMAWHEHRHGRRATYYLLHGHRYWQDDQLVDKCRQLAAYGHEIALHLNVLTEWMSGACDDVDARLRELMGPLRKAGIRITGTSAHGDRACYEHSFINYWIWRELRGDDPAAREHGLSAEGVPDERPERQVAYPADHRLRRADGKTLELWSSSLAEHGLAYDAMHVPVDRYWTDTGGGWRRSGDPLEADLSRGRHQILIHPFWWRGPKKLYVVLSTPGCGAGWLAGFVDRATSCHARAEWILEHDGRAEAVVPSDLETHDSRLKTARALMADRRLAVKLVHEAAARLRAEVPGDALDASERLEPFLPELRRLGGELVIVHLYRDGRDVVRRLMSEGWYERPDDPRGRSVPAKGWDQLTPLERCCWYHRFTNESIMPCASTALGYETMIADQPALERTLSGMGIVVHPLLAENAFAAEVEPAPAAPPFRRWPEDERVTFERICGDLQRALGYAPPKPGWRQYLRAPWRLGEEEASTLLELGPATPRGRRPPIEPGNMTVEETDDGGLVARVAGTDSSGSNLLLARGTWSRVQPADGIAANHWVYYVCQVVVETDCGVRVFVLWFGEDGRRQSQQHLLTLSADAPAASCTFAAAPGATHLALGLHLGDQPAGSAVHLSSVLLRSVPMGPRYRAALAPAGERGIGLFDSDCLTV